MIESAFAVVSSLRSLRSLWFVLFVFTAENTESAESWQPERRGRPGCHGQRGQFSRRFLRLWTLFRTRRWSQRREAPGVCREVANWPTSLAGVTQLCLIQHENGPDEIS